MNTDADPEDPLAEMTQEATNQSTPDKSLAGPKENTAPKMKRGRRQPCNAFGSVPDPKE